MSTLVYRYGLLAPIAGEERVREQMSLAHRYYNTLVEIARDRIAAMREILTDERTAAIDERVAALEQEVSDLRAVAAARRKQDRDTAPAPAGVRSAIAERVTALRALRTERRAIVKALAARPDIAARIGGATTMAKERAKLARSTCNVYWGTYLLIEQAVMQASGDTIEPRFRRWSGDGVVAVQIQLGCDVAELVNAECRSIQIDLVPRPVPGRGGKPLPRLRLRVGSDGRDPIWAEWPIILHRPLPAGARVKGAKVVLTHTGPTPRWSLHVVLDDVPDKQDGGRSGVVAVDLRWRQERGGDGPTISAGRCLREDGTSVDVLLEPAVRGALRKADDIRSIRDKSMEEIRARVIAWSRSHALDTEHAEQLATVHAWRAQRRFAALCGWWRAHRCAGDDELVERLESWRKQDKHLWLWESHARRKALARRRDAYRALAARLAREHKVLVIERLNIARLVREPAPEEEDGKAIARQQHQDAAPGELRAALIHAFRSRGGEIVEVGACSTPEAMLAAYREGQGAPKVKSPARSVRFMRMRKLPVPVPA